jgi:hypothetical protein
LAASKFVVGCVVMLSCCLPRLRLFRSINQHPTLYEVVTGKHRAVGKENNKRKRPEAVRLSRPGSGCSGRLLP